MLNKILELSKYRLSKAREELDTSIELIGIGRFSQSVNRSYYSIFHAVRALFAIEEVDFKKHSGVISHFQHNYINYKIYCLFMFFYYIIIEIIYLFFFIRIFHYYFSLFFLILILIFFFYLFFYNKFNFKY